MHKRPSYDETLEHNAPLKKRRIEPEDGQTSTACRRQLNYDAYTVGLVCVLQCELNALRLLLDEEHEGLPPGSRDDNVYLLGRVGNHNVVISFSGLGNPGTNAAARTVTHMIRTFRNIRFGLMVGIGGGAPKPPDPEDPMKDIRLGDVVVSSPRGKSGGVLQYDMGKWVNGIFHIESHLTRPPTILLKAVQLLQSDHDFGTGGMTRYIDEATRRSAKLPALKNYQFPGRHHDRLFKASCSHTGGANCSDCDTMKLERRLNRDSSNPLLGDLTTNNNIDDNRKAAILNWLTPTDYGLQQSDYFRLHQEGTGNWLLCSEEFQQWLHEENQTLFCQGIPGAGKTIMTSIIINYLNARYRDDQSVGIAYIYCDYQRQHEQKPFNLLASLLKQLIWRQLSFPDTMTSLYDCHKREQTQPTLEEILRELQSAIANYRRVFIVIDALDECQSSQGVRRRFLNEIFAIQDETRASVFATSRYIAEIREAFEARGSRMMKIRASDEDVRRYLEGNLFLVLSSVAPGSELEHEIKATIIEAADGMFLLARLHLESLQDKASAAEIRLALEKLPTGLEAYNKAYETAMRRVQDHMPGFKRLALRALAWIACAKRPLTTQELQVALAVKIGTTSFNDNNLTKVSVIVSQCAGLVTVDRESSVIRLAHYTVKGYFDQTWNSWFPDAHTDIARTCVTFLSFIEPSQLNITGAQDPEIEEDPDEAEYFAEFDNFPLYAYAAQNWGHHALQASASADEDILNFLNRETGFCISGYALLWLDSMPKVPLGISGVHLAAYFGLKRMIRILLSQGHRADSIDYCGRTPLLWAMWAGKEEIVELLLQDPIIDVESIIVATPLLFHKDILELDGLPPSLFLIHHQKNHQLDLTPLSWASFIGNKSLVTLVLARTDVGLNSKDPRYGRSPLWWAVSNSHEEVVRLLVTLDRIDLNSPDNRNQTPLIRAAANGRENLVSILLEKDGVDINFTDKYGMTPLSWAAWFGHASVAKMLSAKDGILLNLKEEEGHTPLAIAAENGHKEVVELLLNQNGVDWSTTSYTGQTPRSLASKNGHEEIVRLLRSNDGVDLSPPASIIQSMPTPRPTRNDLGVVSPYMHPPRMNYSVASEGRSTRLPVVPRRGHMLQLCCRAKPPQYGSSESLEPYVNGCIVA